MLRCANRSGMTSVTNVALGCIAIAIVVSIATLSSDLDSERSTAPSAAVAPSDKSVARPNLSPSELYERVAPSVVTIIVKDENGEAIGTGSGFFIDDALLAGRSEFLELEKSGAKSHGIQVGCVVTNYHVIRPAVGADIVMSEGDKCIVRNVVAEDQEADLALLSVLVFCRQPLKTISLASEDPRILSTVYAIGSPKGLHGSASEGKVSAYRELHGGERWLQTTTPISPGSSGGPLLLSDGSLAGVTTMFLADAQNLNFAIPVSAVRKFLATADIRPRDVSEGASISWHGDTAFSEMAAMVEFSETVDEFPYQYTASEKKGIALLNQAREAVFQKANVSQDVIGHYRQSIELAQEATRSLPQEFKYLGNYLMGMAGVFAASESSRSSADRGILTKEESSALYRASAFSDFALRHLKLATRRKPDSPLAYQQLYFHYSHSGDWVDALSASDRLVALMPRCANALQYRGSCYFALNRTKSGLDDFRAAIDLSPKNGLLRMQLAERLSELGEYHEAISEYEIAFEILEKDPGIVPLALARYRFGVVYMNAGNFEKAIFEFTKARAMGFSLYFCEREIAKCRQKQR